MRAAAAASKPHGVAAVVALTLIHTNNSPKPASMRVPGRFEGKSNGGFLWSMTKEKTPTLLAQKSGFRVSRHYPGGLKDTAKLSLALSM